MKRITSRQNAVVGRYKATAAGSEPGVLLLDGLHLVQEAIASGVVIRHALVSASCLDRPEVAMLVASLVGLGAEVLAATAPVMAAASPVRSSSLIVALGERPPLDAGRLYGRDSLIVVASGV